MGTSVYCIDTVSEAEGRLGKTIVVLKGCLNNGAIYRFGDLNWVAVAYYPISVKVAHEASNSTLKVEGFFAVFPFILQAYFQLLVQVGHLAQTLAQGIKIVIDFAKYLFVGKEGDSGAGTTGFTHLGDLSLWYALLVFLLIKLTVATDVDHEPGGKSVYH